MIKKANKQQNNKNLNFKDLKIVFYILVGFFFFFLPKIFINNNIYYFSRDISVLRVQESVLYEENKDIKRKLEKMRYKNQILDFLN